MERFKIVLGYICVIIIVLLTILIFKLRFENPELTETQIFLKVKWFLLGLVFCVYGFKQFFK